MESLYIKELKKGSHQAFQALYDRYADRLYGFALLHTKSSAMAQDIVQDTFLKLWDNRRSLSEEGSFKSLLFTMTKNRIIDAFRTQIHKVEFENYMAFAEEEELAENSVERHIYYDDFLRKLDLSKKTLTERQCLIFELSREQGLNIEKISKQLEISEQTVKNQLTTALKTLRHQLKEFYSL